MTTASQTHANRKNAQRSTGPRTPAGKARAAANPIQHGLTSQQVVIAGEDPAAYRALLASLHAEWSPQGPTEEHLVEQISQSQWRLARIRRLETAVWDRALAADSDPLAALASPELDKLRRYETAIERTWHRSVSELRRQQRDRKQIGSASKNAPVPNIMGLSPRELHKEWDDYAVLNMLRASPTESPVSPQAGLTRNPRAR